LNAPGLLLIEQCIAGNYSVCERSNRNKDLAAKAFGRATAGLFGYSHLTGGIRGRLNMYGCHAPAGRTSRFRKTT
jgi:hypothetical protein